MILRSRINPTGGKKYTSGWVDTQSKWSQVLGKWEIRAKLPFGQGMWPAHWLMPDYNVCWPMGGEIDIMVSRLPIAKCQ